MSGDLTIGAGTGALLGQAANDACREQYSGVGFPLVLEVQSHLPYALELPEARLSLGAAATANVRFRSFGELQRLVTTISAIAKNRGSAMAITIRPDKPPVAVVEPPAQAAAPAAAPPDPGAVAVTVIRDDDEDFVVEAEGIQFRPRRNQVRDDGTLTTGGMRALEAALRGEQ